MSIFFYWLSSKLAAPKNKIWNKYICSVCGITWYYSSFCFLPFSRNADHSVTWQPPLLENLQVEAAALSNCIPSYLQVNPIFRTPETGFSRFHNNQGKPRRSRHFRVASFSPVACDRAERENPSNKRPIYNNSVKAKFAIWSTAETTQCSTYFYRKSSHTFSVCRHTTHIAGIIPRVVFSILLTSCICSNWTSLFSFYFTPGKTLN